MPELARFPSPRAKARFSASSFCGLTLRTASRSLRLLVKQHLLSNAAVLPGALSDFLSLG